MTHRDDLIALRDRVRERFDRQAAEYSGFARRLDGLFPTDQARSILHALDYAIASDSDMLCILDALIEGEG